ncbi:MAG: cupin domain-containing protein [Xanthomonadales bacterium]|nr:cupin domain-containing protein [Xanthomonadales bacterium]
MRFKSAAATCLAFVAGLLLSPLAQRALAEARAEPAPLQAEVIDLMALGHDDLPATGNPQMRARSLVVTDSGTLGIQSGNVAKHRHMHTTEVQYIIAGSGAMWLGNERREFKPGSLIVIPAGTAHGGTLVHEGPVKALAIKLPPQPPGDIEYLD